MWVLLLLCLGCLLTSEGKLHVNRALRDGKERVQIVVWDKIRGYLNWLQDWFQDAARTQCSTECLITEDHSKIDSADIVLFHAPTHKTKSASVPSKKSKKNSGQDGGAGAGLGLHVLLSMEQPKYAHFMADLKYLQNFDLLVTYALSNYYPGTRPPVPNLPVTYFPLNVLPVEAVLQPAVPFSEKTGYGTGVSVVAFVSNCKKAGAEHRAAYLAELMSLVGVHSYGGCLKNREEPPMEPDPRWPHVAQKRARKIKVLSNYKFYLAFENSQVWDYVSEKPFESLFAGAVPIYRGADRIHLFMPSNDSYIDANNLSAAQLAKMIKFLEHDEAAYNKYLQYKAQPVSEQFQQIALDSYTHPNVMCRLCEYASSKKHGRQLADDEMHFRTSNDSNPNLHSIRWEGDV